MAVRALVVGGTGGIGYAMACRIAGEVSSSSVIISGRSKPANIPHSNMEFRPLDASSMRQIKKYTDTFKSTPGEQLDLLIMTQGIMTMAGRTETPEGIDRKMALHYYGKQLLIRELMSKLKDDAKVIIVLDGKYGRPTKLNWDDLDLETNYNLANAGNHCIVMTDIMVQYYAAQQKEGSNRRHFFHAFPGGVNTGLYKELPWILQPLAKGVASVVGTSPATCAEHLLTGVSKCASQGAEEGRYWSNIDSKGGLVAGKTIWNEDQLKQVSDHTWQLVDRAIGVSD